MNTTAEGLCEHEAPPYKRQMKATPLPSPGESAIVPCLHCGAPLQRARDQAMWTGWRRVGDRWAACLSPLDAPEYYTRDGKPPEV